MAITVPSGLEGVVAFQTTIAEPDKEGGALRYRGVDIEDLVGNVPFEKVWGLLVDGKFEPGMPPAVPYPIPMRTGDTRVDVQAALAQLAPAWGFKQLLDIDDEEARDNLARTSVMALSFVAQSARGTGKLPVPERDVDQARSIPERFLIRWRAEARGGGEARGGRAGRAQGAPPGPRARHERRVLVGRRPRLRGCAARPLHTHVHVRPRGRLVGPHPRAEARGPPDTPDGRLR